jgi:hypothetical protein
MLVSRFRLAALLTALTVSTPVVSAQAPSAVPPPPVTTVLAMLKVTPGVTRDAIMTVMQDEVRDTVLLYLDGHITQWYSRADSNGVVFMLDVSSVQAAKAMTDRLPLVKAGLASFDFIPLSPLNPLRVLLNPPVK